MSKFPLNKTLVAVCLLVFLVVAPGGAWAESFIIKDFQSEIYVQSDYSYQVEEELLVEFSEPRHGIFRDIPLAFADRPVSIKNIQVEGDKVSVSTNSQRASLQIGDADILVDGQQRYHISYELHLGSDGDTDRDLFYLNLTGSDWGTPIEAARIRVHLPFEANLEELNITRGTTGSEDTSDVDVQKNDQSFTVTITEPLNAREGVTAYLELPEGYYEDMAQASPLLGFTILLLSAGLVLVSFIIWRRKGKDDPLIITPEFYPPEAMTPAEAGFIIDKKVDAMDITSLILYWASRGHIEMEEDGRNHFILYKIKDLPSNAKHFERYFFDALFGQAGGEKVSTKKLKGSFYQEMATTQAMVKSHFTDDDSKRLYNRDSLFYRFIITVFAFLPLWTLIGYGFYLDGNFTISIVELVISALLSALPLVGGGMAFHGYLNRHGLPKASLIGRMLLGGVISFIGLLLLVFIVDQAFFIHLLVTFLMSLLMVAIAQATEKRTPYGNTIKGQVLGHKLFLTTAEKDRIEQLLDDDPNYFYDILPYAQVLHVTKKWSKKFEGLDVQAPDWYRGSDMGVFNAYLFASSMNRSLAMATSEISVNPQSNSGGSGFSGGGFSGGGAGGGGGGSW